MQVFRPKSDILIVGMHQLSMMGIGGAGKHKLDDKDNAVGATLSTYSDATKKNSKIEEMNGSMCEEEELQELHKK